MKGCENVGALLLDPKYSTYGLGSLLDPKYSTYGLGSLAAPCSS
jgi:hypothetical protein